MKQNSCRKLSILLSEGCTASSLEIARLLAALRIPTELHIAPAVDIPSLLSDKPADALILSPSDFELAEDVAARSYAAVLIVADEDALSNLRPACIMAGILTATHGELGIALPQLLAMCSRLRHFAVQTSTLQRKLNDTRLVNRAKLLLMSRLKMSENEAHRYIEKTAMDNCAKLSDVAESIIRTYEE